LTTGPTKKPKRLLAILVLVLVVVVPVLLFFIGPLALLAHDDGHRTTVQCDVQGSRVGTTSAKSLKGAGASGTQVVVTTSNCGLILLRDGITSANAEDVAKRLNPGRVAEFDLGDWTYELRGMLAVFGISPAAYSYRLNS